jgi:hypothetical protein
MSRRDEWRKILDPEVQRWSALSWQELVSRLQDIQCYEIKSNAKTYQVEVELLENTDTYVHVLVAVDDGTLPASMTPLTESFIREKRPSSG